MDLMKRSVKRKANLTPQVWYLRERPRSVSLVLLASNRLIDTIPVRRYKMPFLPFQFYSQLANMASKPLITMPERIKTVAQQPFHTAVLRQGSQAKLTGQEVRQSQHRHSESLRWRRETYGAASSQQEKEDIPSKLTTTNTTTTPRVETNALISEIFVGMRHG